MCSFSKIAGFTGTRCGYTVVPQALDRRQAEQKMWLRRRAEVQRRRLCCAARCRAVFTDEGMKEISRTSTTTAPTPLSLRQRWTAGVWYCGGKNGPYIWLRCPNEMGGWGFDWLLEHAHVVGTPKGLRPCGKGVFPSDGVRRCRAHQDRRTSKRRWHCNIAGGVYTMKPNENHGISEESPPSTLPPSMAICPVRPIGPCGNGHLCIAWARQ